MINGAWVLALTIMLQSPAPQTAAPPPPDTVPDRPLQDIVVNLGRDLRRLPSTDSAIILSVGGLAALAARPSDHSMSRWVLDCGPASYTTVGRTIGNGWTQGGAALGTYVTGVLVHDRFTTHIGSDLIRAQALNAVLTRGIKLAAQRHRPNGGSSDSFPSGHTSASFTTAAVLEGHFGWKVGIPAFAVAGFVGWTRVRDDVHWLTDVVVGGSLGTIVGHAVTRGHRRQQWSVVPVATGDQVAIYIYRNPR